MASLAGRCQPAGDAGSAGCAGRTALPARPASVPLWFPAALAPMVVSEIVRLAQTDPLAWIACDYGGRIAALAVLAAVPAARRLAFSPEKIRIAWWEAALWITLIVGSTA
jgi:hypothetical protein